MISSWRWAATPVLAPLRHLGITSTYDVLVTALALLLLAAAGLKAQALLRPGAQSLPDWKSGWTALAVGTEWLLGAWLLSGLWSAWSRRAAVALLAVFSATAAWRLIGGERDCGCFGNLKLHPAWTLALDLLAVALIWRLGRSPAAVRRSSPDRACEVRMPARVLRVGVLCISVPAVAFSTAGQLASATRPENHVVLLNAASLPGRPFPLLEHLDHEGRRALTQGRWTVILFDRNCHKCRDYLDSISRDQRGRGRIMAIDIAPRAGAGRRAIAGTQLGEAFLQDGVLVVTEVPASVELAEGVVQNYQLF
jgi:hypothetical protein